MTIVAVTDHPQINLADTAAAQPKAVYSVANGRALLLTAQSIATLTLRTGRKRYIKLRDLPIRTETPSNPEKWIIVGVSTPFFIWREQFNAEIQAHNDKKRFGPMKTITQVVQKFLDALSSPITQLARHDASAQTKLTTEMDSKGGFPSGGERIFIHGNV